MYLWSCECNLKWNHELWALFVYCTTNIRTTIRCVFVCIHYWYWATFQFLWLCSTMLIDFSCRCCCCSSVFTFSNFVLWLDDGFYVGTKVKHNSNFSSKKKRTLMPRKWRIAFEYAVGRYLSCFMRHMMKSPQCAIQIIIITDLEPLTKYVCRKQPNNPLRSWKIIISLAFWIYRQCLVQCNQRKHMRFYCWCFLIWTSISDILHCAATRTILLFISTTVQRHVFLCAFNGWMYESSRLAWQHLHCMSNCVVKETWWRFRRISCDRVLLHFTASPHFWKADSQL